MNVGKRAGTHPPTISPTIRSRGVPACFVYIAKVGPNVKIGLSNDPEKRMAGLSTSLAGEIELIHTWGLATRGAASKLERDLHRMFRCDHVAREWFSTPPCEVIAVGDRLLTGDAAAIADGLRVYQRHKRFSANWMRRLYGGGTERHTARSADLYAASVRRLIDTGMSRNEWDGAGLEPAGPDNAKRKDG